MIDKKDLIQSFIRALESDLKLAIAAQKTTVEYATGEENKAENQYDTRGLEASYLARGQAERVADLKESLAFFKMTDLRIYNEGSAIGNTALITLQDLENNEIKNLLLMPKGGGLQINFQNKIYQTVTASSPLGNALLNKKKDDEISYRVGHNLKEFVIIHTQ